MKDFKLNRELLTNRIDEIGDEFPEYGHLYIVYSPTFPELIKVGKTVNLKTRLRGYNQSNPYSDYDFIAISKILPDIKSYEKKLLELLDDPIYQKEWYCVKKRDIAIQLVENIHNFSL